MSFIGLGCSRSEILYIAPTPMEDTTTYHCRIPEKDTLKDPITFTVEVEDWVGRKQK